MDITTKKGRRGRKDIDRIIVEKGRRGDFSPLQPDHYHSFYEIFYLWSGSCRFLLKDTVYQMEKELDDMENGDNVDSNEETSETPDADKAAETDPAGTAGEPEKEDLSLMEQIREKMQEIYDKLQNGDTETKFMIGNQEFSIKEWDSFLEKFDSVQDAIREALEEKIEKQTEEHFEEEDLEETADKKPDVNQDFSDIPEEIFRKLF